MKRFKHILCVFDPNQDCAPALARADALAQANQARLSMVAVAPRVVAGIGLPEGGPISADLQQATVESIEQAMDRAVGALENAPTVASTVRVGTPFLEVVREVLRNDHDLVIKMAERQDWLDRLFSSDDMHLLRKCPCPVWLVKPGSPRQYRRILAAVDPGDSDRATLVVLNRQILEMAASLALAEFAELHIVHAWEAPAEGAMRIGFLEMAEERITEYVAQVHGQHRERLQTLLDVTRAGSAGPALDYLKPTLHLIKGAARREIPALASRLGVDVVLMGTVARTGIPGLFIGNTAESILGQLDCSVLAIKPPGFVTPIVVDDADAD